MKRKGKKGTSYGGSVLEKVIGSLVLVGFEKMNFEEANSCGLFTCDRVLISNYPYTTIFGTPGKREYFIQSAEWSGQLECKYQDFSGSTDEKMVYISETLKRTDVKNLALVYEGKHWTHSDRGRAIITWLSDESRSLAHQYGKSLLVMDYNAFIKWAHSIWKPMSGESKFQSVPASREPRQRMTPQMASGQVPRRDDIAASLQ